MKIIVESGPEDPVEYTGENLDYNISEEGFLYLFLKTGPQQKKKVYVAVYNEWKCIHIDHSPIKEVTH